MNWLRIARPLFGWLSPATPQALSGALTAFELPSGTDPVKLRKALWDARTEINVIERPDRLLFRISTHFYNTEVELRRLADLLPGMIERSLA
ncbi:MAG UNVERIFIED_CONTAM: hypothetical protein LVQ98_05480 [Rickettsiaceae bacterium]